QILTSLAPSARPPNHAARNRPGSASTMVEAWHDANGAFSKMNTGEASARKAHAKPQRRRERATGQRAENTLRSALASFLRAFAPLRELPLLRDCLEDRRDPLPGADAHGRQAEPGLAVLHGVDQRGGDAGPAGAERVADGDGPTAHVHLLRVRFQQLD